MSDLGIQPDLCISIDVVTRNYKIHTPNYNKKGMNGLIVILSRSELINIKYINPHDQS